MFAFLLVAYKSAVISERGSFSGNWYKSTLCLTPLYSYKICRSIDKMVLKLFFIILMALGAIGEEDFIPEWDRNILSGLETLLKPFVGDSLFDGPTSVCDGPTSANKHVLPTLDKLKYYMYFAASTYFSYDIEDLSCEYCLKFKDKVNNHTGEEEVNSYQ